jgi:bifunctional polynucleotide phosphatase/kinase
MVIMCGLPATGKSTFSKKYFVAEGYVRANKDDHGSRCLKIAKEAVASGKSVVCDNTNVSMKARAEYIAIAKEAGIPVRCFRMTTPRELAEHLNFVRFVRWQGPPTPCNSPATDLKFVNQFSERVSNGEVRRVPDVGFNTANKNWQNPAASEGFSEIVDIPFVPDFAEEKHKTWFTMRTG